jgi:hypothetical protein
LQKTLAIKKVLSELKSQDYFKDKTFYEDGIINEEQFELNPTGKKVLFIAKEPNSTNHEKLEVSSFITEWNEMAPNYPFAKRIAEWAYGIINDFPEFCRLPTDVSYLKKIAFMNVKKLGGGGIADNTAIYQVVKTQREYLCRQIEIIGADLIILCTSFHKEIRQSLFTDCNWVNSGYGVEIAKWNESMIIDFYHPSSRNVPAALYSLLQNVIRSNAFNKLLQQ